MYSALAFIIFRDMQGMLGYALPLDRLVSFEFESLFSPPCL
jgi:hypothetical protein